MKKIILFISLLAVVFSSLNAKAITLFAFANSINLEEIKFDKDTKEYRNVKYKA